MQYSRIKQGTFVDRPNRFCARVFVDGQLETVHVKNTGRCREILQPDARVLLEPAGNPGRKTAYSLVAVYKGTTLINIDSQVPNQVVYEALSRGKLPEFSGLSRISREVRYGNSRFDLYYEKSREGVAERGFIEVKGVTLEQDGLAMFPDAPTERGAKHLLELIEAVQSGYTAHVFFLVQMKGPRSFQPNTATDPKFAAALQLARDHGVRMMVYDSVVTQAGIEIGEKIK